MKNTLLIIANNNLGCGQSGGDTIFLEFIKNWQSKLNIIVFGSQESKNLLLRYHLNPTFIKTDNKNSDCSLVLFNLFKHQIRRFFKGFISYFKNIDTIKTASYCYTASDFFPDFIFGLFYKIANPRGIWLCGQYLFAPSPNNKFNPYQNQKLKGYFYFFYQKFSQYISNKFADQILITSEPDRARFPGKKVIVVRGGVDTTESDKYLASKKNIPVNKRLYDAVFLGRLHPQKGVLELVDIWKLVVAKIPKAQLAIIGDGQLETELKQKILNLDLNKNITLFGFKSGHSKYDIFKNSKIVLHPAIYDSGGMSAAEAMAWGLPGVSFDLESLKTYYPKGMIKTPCFNIKQYSDNIIKLLNDSKLYKHFSNEAVSLIRKEWNWEKQCSKIYNSIYYET